jgi:carbonic anhydrase
MSDRGWNRVALLCAVILTGTTEPRAASTHGWSYEGGHGPEHWGAINGEYSTCATGKEQSPIDIRGATPADLPPITFDYHSAPLAIVDNGHTIQVNVPAGGTITVGGRRYDLVQLHFHRPSEERIDGKGFAMVAHLVHKDAEGKLAVVAVLLREGTANQLVETLWNHLPMVKEQVRTDEGVRVSAERLLPADRGYYTFRGSLTTPPCTEGVTWLVLKTPVEVSSAQIATFAHLYSHNARPVQPRNGRVIRVTK